MKSTFKILASLALLMTYSNLMADEVQAKRYLVKSANVSYEIKGAGNSLGLVDIEVLGKKTLLFNDYGNNELTEENKIEKLTQDGTTKTKKSHVIDYMKGSIIYKVDFDKETILRSENVSAVIGQALSGSKRDVAAFGKDMLIKMGGEQTGTSEVLGYPCDVWELMGVKQCMYKGIPLRIASNVMGLKVVQQATSAEFDIDVSEKDFTLPNYPVFQVDMERLADGKPLIKLDKSKLDEMDRQANLQAAKESKELESVADAIAAAAAKAGVKSGTMPTEAQSEAMIGNMKNAMFPMIKEQILQEEAGARFMAKCLNKADDLKDANQCAEQAAKQFPSDEDDDMEDLEAWNSSVKEEILGDLNGFLEAIDCVKAANNMEALQKCGLGE